MRTPEQVKADDALTEAIIGVRRAYEWDPARLLTDYVVLTVAQAWDDEGYETSEYGFLMRDESLPDYRIIGMLEVVRDRFRARMMAD